MQKTVCQEESESDGDASDLLSIQQIYALIDLHETLYGISANDGFAANP